MPVEPAFEIDPRVAMAAERTLLAWIRTGMAMMGFGFVVARFGLFLYEVAGASHRPIHVRSGGLTLWVGVALILLGVVTNLAALAEHRRYLRELRQGRFELGARWSLVSILAMILALFGMVIVGYMVVIGADPPAAAPRATAVTSAATSSAMP